MLTPQAPWGDNCSQSPPPSPRLGPRSSLEFDCVPLDSPPPPPPPPPELFVDYTEGAMDGRTDRPPERSPGRRGVAGRDGTFNLTAWGFRISSALVAERMFGERGMPS